MAGMKDLAKKARLNPGLCPKCNSVFDTSEALEKLFDLILERVKAGEKVHLSGFGVFYRHLYKGRTVKTPIIDGDCKFDDRFILRFRSSSLAKKYLNKPDRKKKKSKKVMDVLAKAKKKQAAKKEATDGR